MQTWCLVALAGSTCLAADAPIRPVRICEVLGDPDSFDGKTAAIVVRYSFRESGRFVGEDACPADNSAGERHDVRLVFDAKNAPRMPEVFEIDSAVLDQKWKAVKQHTLLGKFRFGSADYDRWAVVYGRVEIRRSGGPSAGGKTEAKASEAQVVCRGESAMLFLHEE